MNQAVATPLSGSRVIRSMVTPSTSPRWGTVAGGAALTIYGLSRRSLLGTLLAAAGGGLAYYAYSSAAVQERQAHGSVLLNCLPEEAYRFWRDFQNLPRFMKHLQAVTVSDPLDSRWIVRGPLGQPIALQSEIVNERENEFIAWRTLPGSDLMIDGEVNFRRAPGGRGTILDAKMHFTVPAGALGRAVGKLLGKDANFMMRQDLRRLKALIETGEIPTTEGQPHGPRSAWIGAARVLSPDEPMRRGISPLRAVEEQRRVS
jgi:uncharacterized membrane protein